jgi:hypothetical protein
MARTDFDDLHKVVDGRVGPTAAAVRNAVGLAKVLQGKGYPA